MKEEIKAADAAMFDVRGWKARPLLRIRYGMFDLKLTESRNRIAKSGELIRPPVNLTSMSDVVQIDAALVNVEFAQDAIIGCSQFEFNRSPPDSLPLPSRSGGCRIARVPTTPFVR